jgi:hypothetical protein
MGRPKQLQNWPLWPWEQSREVWACPKLPGADSSTGGTPGVANGEGIAGGTRRTKHVGISWVGARTQKGWHCWGPVLDTQTKRIEAGLVAVGIVSGRDIDCVTKTRFIYTEVGLQPFIARCPSSHCHPRKLYQAVGFMRRRDMYRQGVKQPHGAALTHAGDQISVRRRGGPCVDDGSGSPGLVAFLTGCA